MRRWPSWLVRTLIFGGVGLLILLAVRGIVVGEMALSKASNAERRGAPSEILGRAQQAVSDWSNQPSVVLKAEREGDHWRAVAMSGTNCYELAVFSKLVSARPGRIACPPVQSASTGDDVVDAHDPRVATVSRFMEDWLMGDADAERFMSSDRLPERLGEVASDVKVTGVFGKPAQARPGVRSVVTVEATATYAERAEQLAWTVVLLREGERWGVEQVAGGEVPTGSVGALTSGVIPVSSTTTTER